MWLPDGGVLVIGVQTPGRWLANTERYDPATGVWMAVADLAPGRFAHTATTLADAARLRRA